MTVSTAVNVSLVFKEQHQNHIQDVSH